MSNTSKWKRTQQSSERRTRSKVHHVEAGESDQEDETEDDFYVNDQCASVNEEFYSVNDIDVSNERPDWWIELLDLDSTIIPFKIDTGANVNILSLSDYRSLKKKPKLHKPVSNVSAYGNHKLDIVGRIVVPVIKQGKKYMMHMVVCD